MITYEVGDLLGFSPADNGRYMICIVIHKNQTKYTLTWIFDGKTDVYREDTITSYGWRRLA